MDDIVVACRSDHTLQQIKQDICRKFAVKDLGKLHHFLGMKVVQDDATGDVWVGQPVYVDKVLKKFGMQEAKAVSTPVDTSAKLTRADGETEEKIESVGGWVFTISIDRNTTRYLLGCWKRCQVLSKSNKETLDCSKKDTKVS